MIRTTDSCEQAAQWKELNAVVVEESLVLGLMCNHPTNWML
jgi:hypothetical protein